MFRDLLYPIAIEVSMVDFIGSNIQLFHRYCQSSRRYGAKGPGQLLVGIRNLGYNRGRDGYAPVPRRGRAISTVPFKNPAVSALAL
jgi:hypothetical protein